MVVTIAVPVCSSDPGNVKKAALLTIKGSNVGVLPATLSKIIMILSLCPKNLVLIVIVRLSVMSSGVIVVSPSGNGPRIWLALTGSDVINSATSDKIAKYFMIFSQMF